MRKITVFFILVIIPVLISGCATGPKKEEVDRMSLLEAQLARMLADLSELQRDARANSDAIQQIRDDVRSFIEELRTDNARSSVKLDSMETRLEALTERIDDSELRISNLRKEVTNIRVSRVGTVFTRPANTEETYTDEVTTETGDERTGVEPSTENESFQIAYSDFLRGDFNLAVTGFRTYIRSYPEGTRAEDAQFFLAESLYNLGDYESAIQEYDALINNYPESQNSVNALYKKGLAYLDSNQTAQGVILLQRLISQHSETNEARLAREKLRSLGLNP
jgi:tol-pal system protein YbgF